MAANWFLKLLSKTGLKVMDFGKDAAEQAIGYATASAIQAPMKPLQMKLNSLFPFELLGVYDLQSLLNRGAIDEAYFNTELISMGYNEEKRAKLKELAGSIPSVSDFIRFAVRDVFTPATAQAYGLYNEYPSDLDKYIKKAGLDIKYAKQYWAAHWELPSAGQGFEMYHRSIISYEQLELLLKSLDIMPAWRDKIIKLSQSPFTRVDVRRMYTQGVLTKDQVVRAYRDLGYDTEKATKLMEFTASSGGGKHKELARSEIINAYNAGLLTLVAAREKIMALGYDEMDTSILMKIHETAKKNKYTTTLITALKREFIADRLDASGARAKLGALGLSGDDMEELLLAWELESNPKVTLPTKKEALGWWAAGKISESDCIQVLREHGYADKWIALYMEGSEGSE